MKKTGIFLDETGIKADSHEVMQDHYATKLLQLEKELNRLNVLEHPVQIFHICERIIKIKSKLYEINTKRP
jgi:hypothetical protein